MKKEFSFKDNSRLTLNNEHFLANYQNDHMPHRLSRNAWTDLRVEQIKKKYDTPSNKKKGAKSFLDFNNKSKERETRLVTEGSALRQACKPLRQSYINNNSNLREEKIDSNEKYSLERSKNVNPFRYPQESPLNNFQQNQKTVFDRIEQMKNCFRSDKKQNLAPYKQTQKELKRNHIDSRVANIDKINDKIKKILDCLHQNEENIKRQRSDLQDNNLKKITNNPSCPQGFSNQFFEQTQCISRQRVSFDTKNSFWKQKSSKTSFNNFFNDKRQKQSELPTFCRETKSPNPAQDEKIQDQSYPNGESIPVNKFRSKSCFGANFSSQKNSQFSDSQKKFDQQILRINERIKRSEEKKKKLEIQFKPFRYEMKQTRSVSKFEPKTLRLQKPPLPMKNSQLECSNQRHRYQRSQLNEPRPINDQEKIKDQEHYPNFLTQKSKGANSRHQSQQNSLEASGVIIQEDKMLIESQDRDNERNYLNLELKQQTDEGIQNRKRRLLETATITFAKETKRFIQQLFQQVKEDEEFRNAKIWLRDTIIEDKWNKLSKALKEAGYEYSLQEIQEQYSVSEDEDNPFFSARQCTYSIEEAIKNKEKAEEHWATNIVHQFSQNKFSEESFTAEKIDFEKKGYFVLEDLVRFINMQTGSFYRNRDLYIVFKRMTKTDKVKFEDLLKLLC